MQKFPKVFTLMSAILALAFCLASCKSNVDDDPTMYTVTVSSSIEHGTVTADKTSAEAGATVKLTATADSGYELESYSVKDASENELTVTDGTFTMPESDVTVSATFKAKSSGGGTTSGGTTSGGTEKQAGSISYTTASISKTTADTAFTNELTKTGDGTVTYASSKETVATVNATTGEVTIVGAGETTITATVADSDTYTYATKTATYTITVTAAAATKTLTLTSEIIYDDYNTGNFVRETKSLEIEYTDNDTWKDIAERYDEVILEDNTYGPEGKVVRFWKDTSEDHYSTGRQLKSTESTNNYNLVSINDKVSAYSSYYLE